MSSYHYASNRPRYPRRTETQTSSPRSSRSSSPVAAGGRGLQVKWKRRKRNKFADYPRGTPLFRKIIDNHQLMVKWENRALETVENFQTILETHLSHSLDFMDFDELQHNMRILEEVYAEFGLRNDCRNLVRTILEQMIELRKKGRPVFKTLVDVDNRRRDKKMVEKNVGLTEQGLLEFSLYSAADQSLKIANGYYRMLYGDHGPYIEFIHDQINWDAFPSRDRRGRNAFFDYWYTKDRAVRLYYQRKDVKNKPNPPRMYGTLRQEHNRPEGYADYVPGRYYLDPKDIIVKEKTYVSLLKQIKR